MLLNWKVRLGATSMGNYQDDHRLALAIRRDALEMTHRSNSSHIGSSLSAAELLAVLYNGVLRTHPDNPSSPDRDRFILSKGHAAAAYYATLAERGFFPKEVLQTFSQDGSQLAGHATHHAVPGIDVSTGSLGHGLPIGCGMALAAKRDDKSYRVFVLLSDGECDEGSTWEAALFAHHHKLDNLIAIIDFNKVQSFGTVKEVLDLEPLAEKWRSFGWAVKQIDGHDTAQIEDTLSRVPYERGKPSCCVAHTVKGKGVSFMENTVEWHYKAPNKVQLERALQELASQ
jgi:transketolase